MKILIAPNSFKEAADSDKVAELLKSYLEKISSYEINTSPVSDGGDGFLNVCKSMFNLRIINYEITTPYDESSFNCETGYDEKNKRMFIESAKVMGLRVIPKEKRHPLNLSSKGLGDILTKIREDVNNGNLDVKDIYLGIGGTGTNDLGLGVCSRFGLELMDIYGKADKVIPQYFYRIKDLKWEKPYLPFNLKVVLDVTNPLMGTKGATKTFGAQKGADKGELGVIELGFNKIINLLKNKDLRKSFDNLSGAGGGLAAGLYLFFDADKITAKEFIGDFLDLETQIDNSDIVITGEGHFDEQTLDGKGAGIILDLALQKNKKVILCCGKIEDNVNKRLNKDVGTVELISFFSSTEESIQNFEKGIELAAEKILTMI
ncbi:MAG TPA: glycerate kinase [Ignavibacteriaceae bacterium]|nr:glycerate kinase [Ignavibacteriaceae bacterium]